MENKFFDVYRIPGMDTKRREYKIINYLLKITSFAKSKERQIVFVKYKKKDILCISIFVEFTF